LLEKIGAIKPPDPNKGPKQVEKDKIRKQGFF